MEVQVSITPEVAMVEPPTNLSSNTLRLFLQVYRSCQPIAAQF